MQLFPILSPTKDLFNCTVSSSFERFFPVFSLIINAWLYVYFEITSLYLFASLMSLYKYYTFRTLISVWKRPKVPINIKQWCLKKMYISRMITVFRIISEQKKSFFSINSAHRYVIYLYNIHKAVTLYVRIYRAFKKIYTLLLWDQHTHCRGGNNNFKYCLYRKIFFYINWFKIQTGFPLER